MKPFMDSDFLLQTDTAKKLYHDYAKQVPVLDYHCHLVPKEIARHALEWCRRTLHHRGCLR